MVWCSLALPQIPFPLILRKADFGILSCQWGGDDLEEVSFEEKRRLIAPSMMTMNGEIFDDEEECVEITEEQIVKVLLSSKDAGFRTPNTDTTSSAESPS